MLTIIWRKKKANKMMYQTQHTQTDLWMFENWLVSLISLDDLLLNNNLNFYLSKNEKVLQVIKHQD